jgi:hypothetical protein
MRWRAASSARALYEIADVSARIPRSAYLASLDEVAEAAHLATVYLLYEQRQEWYDWNGNNMATDSSIGVLPSLTEAEVGAERRRKQGSRFCIDEVPCIAVRGNKSTLILGEVRAACPLRAVEESALALGGARLWDCDRATAGVRRRIRYVIPAAVSMQPIAEVFMRRVSSSGRGGHGLAWSLRPQSIDVSCLQRIAARIDEVISYNNSLERQ